MYPGSVLVLRSITIILLCSTGQHAFAQCAFGGTPIAGGAITLPCPGSYTVPCILGGQYALVNVVAGNIYTFSTCGGATWDTQITLHNNANGAFMGYNDDACGLQSFVTWTATFTGQLRVRVNVYFCGTNAVCAQLAITCSPPPPPVTNAQPCGAIVLPVPEFCFSQTFSNVGAANTAGVPAPGCGGFGATSRDVWFQFTTPGSGMVYIESTNISINDGAMAIYSSASGTCAGPFTVVECDDDDGPGLMPYINRRCVPLAPNTTYFLRYWGYGTLQGSFNICVWGPQVATSAPEDCIGGTTLCNGNSFGNNSSNTGCVADLNASNTGCLLSNEVQGTWYAFQVQFNGQLGLAIDPAPNPVDYDWALWGPYAQGSTLSGVCSPVGAPIRCSYASGPSTFGATGAYATGFGHPVYSPPQYANPLPAWTQNAFSNGWLPGVNVLAGQVYVLYVDNWSGSNQPFMLNWTLSQPDLLDCVVLPVELVHLEAQAMERTIDVLWRTANEQNSAEFVVQRSVDGAHFTDLGSMAASGWSSTLIEYRFTDPGPLDGVNYYRLLQKDLDGQVKFSDMVSAHHRRASHLGLFPNPAENELRVTLRDAGRAHVLLMQDASGRLVMSRRLALDEGSPGPVLSLLGLDAGSYLVQVLDADGTMLGIGRFVKQ